MRHGISPIERINSSPARDRSLSEDSTNYYSCDEDSFEMDEDESEIKEEAQTPDVSSNNIPELKSLLEIGRLIINNPKKVQDIAIKRVPFGSIYETYLKMNAPASDIIEGKVKAFFNSTMVPEIRKAFSPATLSEITYCETSDSYKLNFKKEIYKFSCSCYIELKLIFNIKNNCFDIVIHSVESESIKYLSKTVLPKVNFFGTFISNEMLMEGFIKNINKIIAACEEEILVERINIEYSQLLKTLS